MGRDRAAYMREYRARKSKRELDEMMDRDDQALDAAVESIRALEEEVRHLKAELAKRPIEVIDAVAGRAAMARATHKSFNSRPFTPVPKKRG